MTVKAKFTCSSVIDTSYNQKVINMHAVYSQDGENADFVKATPCGNLNMHIDNDAPALKEFEQGCSYYLYFEKIDDFKILNETR